jgi:predicted metal-dependent peptidase
MDRAEPLYAPSRSGHGAGTIVVGVDTSGSIGSDEVDMFMAEMSGILDDVRPKRIVIMWCDAKVHRVDEVEDAGDLNVVRAKGAPGGGGTAFEPVFDEIDKMGLTPDALVYLTDGQGSFPQTAPTYPTIWGSIYPQSNYPFGDVVNIPKVQ